MASWHGKESTEMNQKYRRLDRCEEKGRVMAEARSVKAYAYGVTGHGT